MKREDSHKANLAAHAFLSTLKVGDEVVLTTDGADRDVTVQRTIRRADEPFGSFESAGVKVGYGIGRWNVEVGVEALASGRYLLALVQS